KKIVGPIEQPLLLLNNAPLGDIYIQTYPQALFSNYLGVAAGIKTYQFLPFVSSNRFARLVQGGIQGLGALSIGITFFAFSSPAESENPIPSFNENFDQIPDLAGPKSTDRDFL
ncbi:MAG: hypothetical protein JNK65_03490, partial [Deltaproteobacteria bacterium]|nr:hypothetical protein [Deltaproteobacteria bacterium]